MRAMFDRIAGVYDWMNSVMTAGLHHEWRRRAVEFKEPRLSRNLRLVELLREIGTAHNVSPAVAAVAWTLHHPAITGAIVGSRSAQQVEGIAPALEFRLSEEEFARINAFLEANPAS